MDEAKLREARARDEAAIERRKYRRIVHLYGDSIARGWGLGVFEDANPLNRVQDIANMLLADNSIPPESLFVRYAWSQDVEQMRRELASGMIVDGDVIVFEDAGPHENNVDARRQRFLNMKRTIEESGRKVSLVLTTMFDYWPTPPYYNSEYDAIVGDSGVTMNDVVRSVATSASSSLLDWNTKMDMAVTEFRRFGISPMHRDAVHPNIFGNLLLAASLLNHIGLPITNYDTIRDTFHRLPPDYYGRLGWARPLDSKQTDEIIASVMKLASHGGTDKNRPNQASEATSEPAQGAASSSPQG